jgi:hypothetical protein
VNTHTFNKQDDKIETNVVCQKADDSYFLGEETSDDGGIHAATRDYNDVTSVLRNDKK